MLKIDDVDAMWELLRVVSGMWEGGVEDLRLQLVIVEEELIDGFDEALDCDWFAITVFELWNDEITPYVGEISSVVLGLFVVVGDVKAGTKAEVEYT